jgi:hypothetical protein
MLSRTLAGKSNQTLSQCNFFENILFYFLYSTPVRSACYMTHIEIVKYLVENGADIRKANYNGGTCLINSVQSAQLCTYLISKGADVNARDIQGLYTPIWVLYTP